MKSKVFFSSVSFSFLLALLSSELQAVVTFEGDWPGACHLQKRLASGIREENPVTLEATKAWLPHVKKVITSTKIEDSSIDEEIAISSFTKDVAKKVFEFLKVNETENQKEKFESGSYFAEKKTPREPWLPVNMTSPESYFSSEEIESLYKGASFVLDITPPYSMILGIGQSPSYLVESLKTLSSLRGEEGRKIMNLPFSGAPDLIVGRLGSVFSPESLVTPSSLTFARNLFEAEGFSPSALSQQKLYLLDYVMTGENIRAFIKFLKDWFDEVQLPYPDLSLIKLEDFERRESSKQKFIFDYSNITKEKFSFLIDTYAVKLNSSLLGKMTADIGGDRIMPPFAADNWNKETYKKLRKLYPTPYAQTVIRNLDKAIKEINLTIDL